MLAIWEYFWPPYWPGSIPPLHDAVLTTVTFDSQLIPWDDDYTIQYPELDSIESLSIIYYSEDDAREEFEDDIHIKLADEVYDTDQLLTILDDQISEVPPHDEDDWTQARVSDEVYDFDHIVVVLDDQISEVPLPDEDDWIDYREEDIVVDFDHITTYYDYLDDELVPLPDEDGWDYPYGVFDAPFVPPVTTGLFMVGLGGGLALFGQHGRIQSGDAD